MVFISPLLISNSIFPSLGASEPDKQDNKLDLPTPDGPSIATREPSGISILRF